MLRIDGDVHIRYLTAGQLKALLAQVDDSLFVTCAAVTGNLVFYARDDFGYDAMRSLIDFNQGDFQLFDVDESNQGG